MMNKKEVLDAAIKAVADRGLNYGKPEDNFERIAGYWRVHFWNRFMIEVPLDGASVAIMMDLMKTARLDNDPKHMDSWIDKAGYAACGGEIASSVEKAEEAFEAMTTEKWDFNPRAAQSQEKRRHPVYTFADGSKWDTDTGECTPGPDGSNMASVSLVATHTLRAAE